MAIITQVTENWSDYELLDTGGGQRLERFGPYFIVRPDPNVFWPPHDPDNLHWSNPDAVFTGDKAKLWQLSRQELEQGWAIAYNQASFIVKPTPFRHMGIFPEQASHWSWLITAITSMVDVNRPTLLNLFAYTGASSVIAALAGAKVTHVDASQGSIEWAKENAKASGLPKDSIRWLHDDVLKFLRREVRRGSHYDFILLDPPVFGRGPKGEIWRLEERLTELAELVGSLLDGSDAHLLLNFYATSLYPESVARVFQSTLNKPLELGSLELQESISGKSLQTGYFLRS